MVTGSLWRFTEDAELRYKVRNPAYAALRDDIESGLQAVAFIYSDTNG